MYGWKNSSVSNSDIEIVFNTTILRYVKKIYIFCNWTLVNPLTSRCAEFSRWLQCRAIYRKKMKKDRKLHILPFLGSLFRMAQSEFSKNDAKAFIFPKIPKKNAIFGVRFFFKFKFSLCSRHLGNFQLIRNVFSRLLLLKYALIYFVPLCSPIQNGAWTFEIFSNWEYWSYFGVSRLLRSLIIQISYYEFCFTYCDWQKQY